MNLRRLSAGLKSAYRGSDVRGRVDSYNSRMDQAGAERPAPGGFDHAETVQEYYDLCSEFMVWGWSESLHFAPLSPRETLEESIVRHQRLMIEKLQLERDMAVIDVGCGVGGPMRRLAREAGVRVLGVNTSKVQLARARQLNAEAGLDGVTEFLETSFMDMGAIADGTFDRGYAIESTCHAPDKAGAFAEIYRVLKPGALLWGQEMCMTGKFDPSRRRHQAIKRELMRGIALKDIASPDDVDRALQSAGFEILEGKDRAVGQAGPSTPWYQPMATQGNLLGDAMRRIPLGRKAMFGATKAAELVGIFPKGTADVVALLDRTANAYVAGGRTGIFTPLYCFLARKPA